MHSFLFIALYFVWLIPLSVQATPSESPKTRWENLPIAAYDSDTGFGIGGKSFLLNPIGHRESFDLTLYASTKGERWARLVISHPDFGLRQGKSFAFSLDAKVEYERMIQSSFFGVGGTSKAEDKETYDKKNMNLEMTAGHGVSRRFSFKGGARYRAVDVSRVLSGGLLDRMGAPNVGLLATVALFAGLQYDTRDSYLRPERGWWLEAGLERCLSLRGIQGNHMRWDMTFRRFVLVFPGKLVWASRLRVQGLDKRGLPVQSLLSLGGGTSLRGYPQDRFLGTSTALLNTELRFPLYKRIGAVLGCDAGSMWESFAKAGIERWAFNAVLGLRLTMDTFIVRLDWGKSSEGSGLYMNFGQVI
jgi:outer membrane protein assembly factor BamA